MTYSDEISDLIAKSYENGLSDSEKKTLHSWIVKSPRNQLIYNELISETKIEERYNLVSNINDQLAFDNVKRRTYFKKIRNSLIRYSSYAAILLLSVFVAYIFSSDKSENSLINLGEKIEPGFAKAVLTLSDGKDIVLNFKHNDTIKEKNFHIVDNNQLVYKNRKIKENLYNKLTIPRGGEYSLVLSDGTKVWLNSESELKYPVSFSDSVRRVYCKGEAYFKVKKDSGTPFVITSGASEIEVLGTEFNLRNYNDEAKIVTTLVEGSVRFNSGNHSIELSPNEQLVLGNNGKLIKKRVYTDEYTSWINGRYIFKSKPLNDVMSELSRWYDIKVKFNDRDIKNKKITGNLKRYSEFQEFVDMLESTKIAKFKTTNDTVILTKFK